MRLVLVALMAGCGFSISAGVPGGGGDDAPADAPPTDGATDGAPDASRDAPMVDACTVVPSGGGTAITGLGGASGNQTGNLACPQGELPIGLAFDVTPGPIATHGNQLLLVNVRARCARVERTTSNQMVSTATATVAHLGGTGSSPSACDPYFPTNPTAEVTCPSGQVLVGVEGNQVDTTLYNTVSIRCAALLANGTVSASTTTLPIAGTGTNQNQPETAICPAGTAITSLVARSGCGQDSVTPTCAALTCP